MESKHWAEDRRERANLIKTEIGYGRTVDAFVVDRGHWHGAERHEITTTGLIKIYSIRSNDLVTVLIARPNQIRRYYEAENRVAPQDILQLAYEHQRKGYNQR
jgi:hypothetical protein